MATSMGKLEVADFLKGLVVAVATATITAFQQFFQADGHLSSVDWKLVGGVALASALGYILKNLLTNQRDEVLGIAATAPETPPPGKK